jgi:hypothetical protein
MKLNSFLRLTSITLLLYLASCAPEDKQETIPQELRDKYIGTWTCKENSSLYNQSSYTVTIKKSLTNNSELLFNNFYQLGATTAVSVSLNGSTFNIASQKVTGQQISGSGNAYSDSYLKFIYTSFDGLERDSVTAIFTR